MTPASLRALVTRLRPLVEAATPGEWRSSVTPTACGTLVEITDAHHGSVLKPRLSIPDAALIVALRNAAPDLLDALTHAAVGLEREEAIVRLGQACEAGSPVFITDYPDTLADITSTIQSQRTEILQLQVTIASLTEREQAKDQEIARLKESRNRIISENAESFKALRRAWPALGRCVIREEKLQAALAAEQAKGQALREKVSEEANTQRATDLYSFDGGYAAACIWVVGHMDSLALAPTTPDTETPAP